MQMGEACAPLATASATLAHRVPRTLALAEGKGKKPFLVYSLSADALNQEEDLNLSSTHDGKTTHFSRSSAFNTAPTEE